MNFVRFMPELHGLRGIAAISVLLFHWVTIFPGFGQSLTPYHVPGHPWLNPSLPFAMGWQGVTLFFVLSGYLLTSHLQNKPLTWQLVRMFYLRRVFRIYPAVWLQLAVLLMLGGLFPQVFVSMPWDQTLLNAMLWVNLPPVYAPMLNDVWWTLPVELLFYASLPLLLVLRKHIGLGLVATLMLLITFGWRGWVMNHYAGQNLSAHQYVLDALPGVLTSFGAGFMAAALQQRVQSKNGILLLGVSALVFLLLQTWLVSDIETYWQGGLLLMVWNTLLSLSMSGIVLAVCHGGLDKTKKVLSARPMVLLGEWSFGIYLWHYPVMMGLKALWPRSVDQPIESLLALGVSAAIALALAALSFHAVEKRMMNMAAGLAR